MASFLRNLQCLLAVSVAFLPLSADAATKKKKPTPPKPSTGTVKKVSPTPRGQYHLLADGELPLAARGAIVIDAQTGLPLYEKNADAVQYPASTTKIMTALLVIEEGNLDQEVEITLEDSKVGESSLYIKPGDRFTRREMLYGLMLKSANDVAHALGRDNAGTMDAFALKMTVRAKELGATNTSFRNPHGLHHLEHYTTPRDLALIARAAMAQPFFREVVATLAHPWPGTVVNQVTSHNRLLRQFPGCTGVKTGYTIPAQQVLVSAAFRGDREVIAVVMHTNKPGIWEDSKLLLTYGFDHPPDPEKPVPKF